MQTDDSHSPTPPEERHQYDSEIDELLGDYIDRINMGEQLDPEQIVSENPRLGREIVKQLKAFLDIEAESAKAIALGTLGDYSLRRQIGRGGMGVVYEAWENSIGRPVALKVLPVGIAADRKATARFMREAQAAGQLTHPNVVGVHAMGVYKNTPYYSMEFVEGETLAQIIGKIKEAEGGVETVFGDKDRAGYFEKIGKAFADVADGLQHAHSKGVTHRDIKPSNLILDSEGRLRILDFGLARLEGQEPLTISGDLVGTPLYMSPEQARQRKVKVDHRTDVYSLGATMYEALCGQPPFKGKDYQDTLSQIIDRDPVEPRKVNQRVPRELETIILKCLRKDAGDRYGTAEALAQDLRRFVRDDPIEARPPTKLEILWRRTRRYRWHAVATTVLLALFGVTALLIQSYSVREQERLEAVYEKRVEEYEKRVEEASLALEALTCAMSIGSGSMHIVDPSGAMENDFRYFLPNVFSRPGNDSLAALVDSLTDAADLLPHRPEAYYFKAKALALQGREPEAMELASLALESDREFEPARCLLEDLNLPLREPESGVSQHFGDQTWQAHWRNAHRALRKLRWKEGADLLGRLSRLYQREGEPYAGASAESLILRGRARLQAANYAWAIEDLGAARFVFPGILAPALLLGKAFYLAGEPEQAERTFTEIALQARVAGEESLTGDPTILIYYLYSDLADWDRSLYWANEIQDKAFRLAAQAACHLEKYDHETAASLARSAVQEDPSLRAGHILFGLALQRQRDYVQAREVFERLVRDDPEYAPGHAYLGGVLCRQGEWARGHKALDEALRLSPDLYQALNIRGAAYAHQGKYPEAERAFKRIEQKHRMSMHNLAWLGWVYIQMERYEDARAYLERALAINPRYDQALWGLSQVSLRQEGYAAGINYFCQAIESASSARAPYGELVPLLSIDRRMTCPEELEKLLRLIESRLEDMDDGTYLEAAQVFALASIHMASDGHLSRAAILLRNAIERTKETDPHLSVLLDRLKSCQESNPEE